MTRKTGELKKRCWLAKQRLKMGYWESLKESEAQNARRTDTAAPSADYAWRRRETEVAAAAPSEADDRMYQKVCEILGGEEIAINPIGQLIERDVYDALDPDGRQRYVLELSEKFRELQERYYRERKVN